MSETREKMIAEIYEKMADKTLSLGCKVKYYPNKGKDGERDGIFGILEDYDEEFFEKNPEAIIGHPVMATDILHYCKENGISCVLYPSGRMLCDNHCNNPSKKGAEHYFEIQFDDIRKPIEDNPSAIEGVYNLIK